MGEVYRARDTKLKRHVAIKILPDAFAHDLERVGRFQREAEVLASLNHPNIAAIYDLQEADRYPFLVLELVEGLTLAERIRQGPLPIDETLMVAKQICEALEAAHQKGIIHRDLKPANIKITPGGQVKVLDFGLAKIAVSPDATSEASTAVPTRAGVVLGTVAYMSPEQVRGEELDPRTDLFSLGAVLYEMVTGRLSFPGYTSAVVFNAILEKTPTPSSRSNTHLPDEFERIIAKALEKDREIRYQHASEMRADLTRLKREIDSRRNAAQTVLRSPARRARKAIDSLAVLPFTNSAADPDVEYLSDGLTETIINTLSQLPKLKVMARSTVFRYKGQDMDPRRVGAELNVRAVLVGRVLQARDALSVGAELVDVTDGSQLWSGQYKTKLADIFKVQDDISREIGYGLRLRLSGDEKKQLSKRYTESLEAYQLYLQGIYYWNKYTPDGLNKAIACFERSIATDLTYALPYTGIADCYVMLSWISEVAPIESFPKAKIAASKALQLDSKLAGAHTSLAIASLFYDWDWSAAEKKFKQAIGLNPNYATAHHFYAWHLTMMGRTSEALGEIREAQERDPLSLMINATAAFTLYCARRYEEAIKQFRKTIEMDPTFFRAHFLLNLVYQRKGMYEEAIAEGQKAVSLSGRSAESLGVLGGTYAAAGKKSEAMSILAELQDLSKQRYVSPFDFAVFYLTLGENDRAFEWFEKAFEERSSRLILLRNEPLFDRFRSEPRLQALMRRIGFANTEA